MNARIMEALADLAAAMPSDCVIVEARKSPGATPDYMAAVRQNEELCLPFDCASASTPEEAVARLKKQAGDRSPANARAAKIATLKQQIAELEAK